MKATTDLQTGPLLEVRDNSAVMGSGMSRIRRLLTILEQPLHELGTNELGETLGQKLAEALGNSRVIAAVNIEGSDSGPKLLYSSGIDDTPQYLGWICGAAPIPSDSVTSSSDESCWHGISAEPGKQFLIATFEVTAAKTLLFAVSRANTEPNAIAEQLEILRSFAICTRSILETKRMLKTHQKTNQLLRESNAKMANLETLAALSDMTSGVAHDFNNIFGALIGRMELMKLRTTDEKTIAGLREMEAMILEGADTVKRIQEFTSSARYKTVERVNLADAIEAVLAQEDSSWRIILKEKNLTLKRFASLDQAWVKGNPEDLRTALRKLLQNAAEASDEGGMIELILSETHSSFQIEVLDYGAGIPEELQKKIFYPFFTTKGSRGAGLGLSIVHGVVVRHGGSIKVHSSPGNGASFVMSIPKAEPSEQSSEQSKIAPQFRQLRILVVDDDDQIRGVLQDMLAVDGHETVTCMDGASALKSFEAEHFDLVITDLGMPGMSGLELAERVYRSNPSVPIAMITGWGTQLSQDDVASKGVRAVLAKPFHLKDIKSLIEELTR